MSQKIDTPDIYEDLKSKLMTAYFTQGQKLKPSELTALYGCSVNTIREILFRLTTVGLVTAEEQRGFRSHPASQQRQHDLTSFRITLEQQGTLQSMRNGGIDWEARLTAAHHKLSHIESRISKSGDVIPLITPWCAAEWEFHETLISASDSPILRETYKSIYDQFRQQLVTRTNSYGFLEGNITEHKRIVDAALTGNTKEVCHAIHDHLSRNLIKN